MSLRAEIHGNFPYSASAYIWGLHQKGYFGAGNEG